MYSFECPVKPGQMVWGIRLRYTENNNWNYVVIPIIVTHISFMDGSDGYKWYLTGYDDCTICMWDGWMRTVFPTREEAEAALKKKEDVQDV